jgi:pyruvate/2-oxoglutarate dehydrogenase complex dihydrolipoamide acyltransferase (E2) component
VAVELRVEGIDSTGEVATVVEWFKREGDQVAAGEVVVQVEVDKAGHDLTAPATGILREILILEGEEIALGGPIAIIDEASG